MSDELGVLITCGGRDARELQAELEQRNLGNPMVSQRKGIGGEVAEWMLLLGAVTPVLLQQVLGLVADRVGPGRVTKIRVGDIEIENPTKEQVELLLAQHTPKGPEPAS